MTTPDAVAWTMLDEVDPARWRTARLPDSSADVELLRLHAFAGTGASVSLVRFPPGWERAALGAYAVAEEFTVLDGAVSLAEERFGAGDYAWIGAGVPRRDMSSPDGAFVVAMFTGPAEWTTDPARLGTGTPVHRALQVGALRPSGTAVDGDAVVADLEPAPADVDRDVLDLAGRRWAFVPAGAVPPSTTGPVQLRTW